MFAPPFLMFTIKTAHRHQIYVSNLLILNNTFVPNVWAAIILTHWGWGKVDAILQIFANAFSWMKTYEFWLRFHWCLFLRVQLTVFHHWFGWWFGTIQATSHYLNWWWLVSRCIYAWLGINELTLDFPVNWYIYSSLGQERSITHDCHLCLRF